jgi:hypothetical protein
MRARLIGLVVLTLTATVVALSVSAAGDLPSDEDYGAAAAGCAVSETVVARPPGQRAGVAEGGWVEHDGLGQNIGEKATIVGTPDGRPPANPDPGVVYFELKRGAIRQKYPWFRDRRDRRARGNLSVKGQTIQPGPKPVQSRIQNHRGPTKHVVPGNLSFPRTGCWRVNAKSGKARLSFVVWVTVAPAP